VFLIDVIPFLIGLYSPNYCYYALYFLNFFWCS